MSDELRDGERAGGSGEEGEPAERYDLADFFPGAPRLLLAVGAFLGIVVWLALLYQALSFPSSF